MTSPAALRHFFGFLSGLLLLAAAAYAQAPAPLQRPVRVAATDAPLEQVLRDIARQSGVPFSYSSTFIPLQKRVTLHTGGPQPVGAVLARLFRSRHISYQLIGGQVVLWQSGAQPPLVAFKGEKAAARAASGLTERGGKAASVAGAKLPPGKSAASGASRPPQNGPTTQAGRHPAQLAGGPKPAAGGWLRTGEKRTGSPRAALGARAGVAAETEHAVVGSLPDSATARPPSVPAAARQAAEAQRASAAARLREQARGKIQAATATLARTTTHAGQTLSTTTARTTRSAHALADSLAAAQKAAPLRRAGTQESAEAGRRDTLTSRRVTVRSSLAVRDTLLAPVPVVPVDKPKPGYYYQAWQVSLVSPLGSNGLKSGRTVNGASLNVVAGYSAGLAGVELGGLLNVARDTVRGVQLAGLLNVVGTEVKGAQLAGLFNIIGGSAYGLQAAGLGNIGRDDVRGLQLAGLFNIGGGAARSRQNPTRPTLVRRMLGLPRLLATDSAASGMGAPNPGARPGPLLQAAGLFNLTGNDVTGLQTAPLLNVARQVRGLQFGLVNVSKHVRGVQFGLINVADSVDGVALGILNIVRHGYLRGEVWASESLPLNAVLKLGVRRYYTMVGVATQPFGTQFRWAGGFGVGTASRPHGRFTYSLDLMQWGLAEPGVTTNEPRLLSQLRPAVAWQIEPVGHLQLVLAPTLNFALAHNRDSTPDWGFGQNQKLLLNHRSARSLTRLWPGLSLGLRF